MCNHEECKHKHANYSAENAPVSGKVSAINNDLESNPNTVNEDTTNEILSGDDLPF